MSNEKMLNVYVGRQPIYNRSLKVVGYELLFRSYDSDSADFLDGDRATSQVILNSFLEIGLDNLVGAGMAFINFTRSFILGKYPLPMAENRVVLEVLEDIVVDDELVAAVEVLSEKGYQIALDDVVQPDLIEPLLDIASIVKLDLMDVDRSRLAEYVEIFKKKKVKMLAEKVETEEEFEMCKKLGFHYYQGYYFSRPHIVKGRKIPESRLALLRLLSKMQKPGIEFKEMEEIIMQDVSISYKLLRLINSSYYARPKKINSIRQALTLLGIKQIKDWVNLLALSTVEEKPRELMVTAMVRGKMVEGIAEKMKLRDSEAGFTVGLFSVLDALLDQPIDEILKSLPLTDDVTSALISHEGKLGTALHAALAYELSDWGETECAGFSPDVLRGIYLDAVAWATELSSLL